MIGHGNGVIRSDAVELDAYAQTLVDGVALASVKSVTGELGEAAGVASCIAAMDALARESVPPTFNFSGHDATHDSGPDSRPSISGATQECPGARQALVTQRSFLGISCGLVISRA